MFITALNRVDTRAIGNPVMIKALSSPLESFIS